MLWCSGDDFREFAVGSAFFEQNAENAERPCGVLVDEMRDHGEALAVNGFF